MTFLAPPADPVLLDDEERLSAADRHGRLRALAGAGALIRRARTATAEADLGAALGEGRPRGLVLVARGGATTAVDLLRLAVGPGCPIPLDHVDGPRLPGWVGALDLVIAVDPSGVHQAVVAAVGEAARRGSRVLTIGSDGGLADAGARARGTHIPTDSGGVGLVDHLAVWSCLVPLLEVAGRLDLVSAAGLRTGEERTAAIDRLADLLDQVSTRCRPGSAAFVNPAKRLALDLGDALPVACALTEESGPAARRLARSLLTVAGHPALTAVPPADLDALALLEAQRSTVADPSAGFDEEAFFRDRGDDPDEPEPVSVRLALIDVTADADDTSDVRRDAPDAARLRALADGRGIPVNDVTVDDASPDPGRSTLERTAILMALADFTGAYLALARGIAPGAGRDGDEPFGGGQPLGDGRERWPVR